MSDPPVTLALVTHVLVSAEWLSLQSGPGGSAASVYSGRLCSCRSPSGPPSRLSSLAFLSLSLSYHKKRHLHQHKNSAVAYLLGTTVAPLGEWHHPCRVINTASGTSPGSCVAVFLTRTRHTPCCRRENGFLEGILNIWQIVSYFLLLYVVYLSDLFYRRVVGN